MRRLNLAINLHHVRRELYGFDDIHEGLANITDNYEVSTLMFARSHNCTRNKVTGFTPNELRFFNEQPPLLDTIFRLKNFQKLNRNDYIKNSGIVDYKKYALLMRSFHDELLTQARRNHLDFKRKLVSMRKSLKIDPFNVGDFVFLKNVNRVKGEVKFGWIIEEVIKHPKSDKFNYRIRNTLTGDVEHVNRGRLVRFHKPVFADHSQSLKGPADRLENLQEQRIRQRGKDAAKEYINKRK